MIGYEFEFFMQDKNTNQPINHEQFNKLHQALEKDGWKIEKDLFTGGIVGSKKNEIKVTTDDSIYVTEVNMPPRNTINEADKDLRDLLNYLNKLLEPLNIRNIGIGMFPSHVPNDYDYTCNKAFIRYLVPRRYCINRILMHKIAAAQYWFDVPKNEIIEYVNLMNRLNGLSVALFGNSSFSENKQNLNIEERLPAWEKFVESPYEYDKKITGIPEKEFKDFFDYLDYCFKSIFYGCAWYSGMPYYLEDHSKTNEDYFFSDEIEVLHVDGQRKTIKPSLGDSYDLLQKNIFLDCRAKYNFKENAKIEDFRKAYKEKNEKTLLELIDKAFVESRFIASQNKEEFSTAGAFLTGLLENLNKTKELLEKKDYSYWKELRKKAIEKGLDFKIEEKHITEILSEFMLISEDGLKKRGFGEEKFLKKAKEFLLNKENPGQRKIRLFEEAGIQEVIEDSLL